MRAPAPRAEGGVRRAPTAGVTLRHEHFCSRRGSDSVGAAGGGGLTASFSVWLCPTQRPSLVAALKSPAARTCNPIPTRSERHGSGELPPRPSRPYALGMSIESRLARMMFSRWSRSRSTVRSSMPSPSSLLVSVNSTPSGTPLVSPPARHDVISRSPCAVRVRTPILHLAGDLTVLVSSHSGLPQDEQIV